MLTRFYRLYRQEILAACKRRIPGFRLVRAYAEDVAAADSRGWKA